MNKRGFTLIELLGSIIILAIIAVVAFPAILNSLGNSQKEVDSAMREYAISAAREYVNDNVNNYPKNGSKKVLKIQTLIDNGYISDDMISDSKNKEMKNDQIEVTNDSKKYIYQYVEK